VSRAFRDKKSEIAHALNCWTPKAIVANRRHGTIAALPVTVMIGASLIVSFLADWT
jgi:hypothetical protein